MVRRILFTLFLAFMVALSGCGGSGGDSRLYEEGGTQGTGPSRALQTGGRVTLSNTGQGLPGVMVVLEETGDRDTTDSEGRFRIESFDESLQLGGFAIRITTPKAFVDDVLGIPRFANRVQGMELEIAVDENEKSANLESVEVELLDENSGYSGNIKPENRPKGEELEDQLNAVDDVVEGSSSENPSPSAESQVGSKNQSDSSSSDTISKQPEPEVSSEVSQQVDNELLDDNIL